MEFDGFILLFVLSVVNWRVSNLIVNEHGIFHIFLRLRYSLGIKYEDKHLTKYDTYQEYKALIYDGEDKDLKPIVVSHIGEIFTCIYCLSVWLSPIIVILFIGFNQQFLLNILFLASMAILIEESK